jgi:hypothetical protein
MGNGLTPLSICSNSNANFTLDRDCGDLSLSRLMGGKDILSIIWIAPNPTSSGISIQFHIPTSYQNDGLLEVYDALGNLEQRKSLQFGNHLSSENILLSLKESGVHYIRVKSSSGVYTKMVVVEK